MKIVKSLGNKKCFFCRTCNNYIPHVMYGYKKNKNGKKGEITILLKCNDCGIRYN
jgi:flavoprotein